jgi:hypothetical protein
MSRWKGIDHREVHGDHGNASRKPDFGKEGYTNQTDEKDLDEMVVGSIDQLSR